MKKIATCLIFMLLFVGYANAQRIKTMTGTVVKTVFGGRWSGIIIRVGNKQYGVQTSYEPSAGDETRGERGWQVKTVGNLDEGREVQVFYTKIDCTFAYEEGVPCWLKATKIVETSALAQPRRKLTGSASIRDTNFRKLRFPIDRNYSESGITQQDLKIEEIDYGDLDGDGAEEAAVLIVWSFARQRGNGWGYFCYIYRIINGKATVVTKFEPGHKSEGLWKLNQDIQNNLLIHAGCYSAGSDYFLQTTTYRLNGNSLDKISQRKRSVPSCQ